MTKELNEAIAQSEKDVGMARRRARARTWEYVRVETLTEWAEAQKEENVQARLEELARTYFGRPETAAVRIGTDTTNACLYAVWKRDGEPFEEPAWDGTPSWIQEDVAPELPSSEDDRATDPGPLENDPAGTEEE